jgi:hypothetical protein
MLKKFENQCEDIFYFLKDSYSFNIEIPLNQFIIVGDFKYSELIVSQDQMDDDLYLQVNIANKDLNKTDVITEEISHLYLIMHRASNQLNICREELEIQAEVDKFLFAWMNLSSKRYTETEKIFQRHFYHHTIKNNETIYHRADYLAAKFCRYLINQPNASITRIKQVAKRFFHANLAQKRTMVYDLISHQEAA